MKEALHQRCQQKKEIEVGSGAEEHDQGRVGKCSSLTKAKLNGMEVMAECVCDEIDGRVATNM